MDPELRRYLNGLFVLLVINIGVNLAQNPVELGVGVLVAGVFGGLVYLFVVDPDAIRIAPPE